MSENLKPRSMIYLLVEVPKVHRIIRIHYLINVFLKQIVLKFLTVIQNNLRLYVFSFYRRNMVNIDDKPGKQKQRRMASK